MAEVDGTGGDAATGVAGAAGAAGVIAGADVEAFGGPLEKWPSVKWPTTAGADAEAESVDEPPEKKPAEAPGGGAEPFDGPLEKEPSEKPAATGAGLLAGAAPEAAAGSACCLAMSAAYMSRCLAAGSWFLPPSLGAGSLLAGTTAGGGATGA